MSLHAFGPHGPIVAPAGTSLLLPAGVADRVGLPGPRSFAVRVRFATPAARASGFEVVAAEAGIGVPGEAGRLGWVVEVDARDLLILVDDAADPDAALGVAVEALRESLVTFRVATVGPWDGAMGRVI